MVYTLFCKHTYKQYIMCLFWPSWNAYRKGEAADQIAEKGTDRVLRQTAMWQWGIHI